MHCMEHTEEAGPSQQGEVPARETIPPHDVNEENVRHGGSATEPGCTINTS